MTQVSVTHGVLGIVVVNFGSHALLERYLVPLELTADVRVVVVDNFSSADERQAVQRLAIEHGWAFVAITGNEGFGAGVNAGVRRAARIGCSTFLILNPDAQITPEIVSQLHDHVRREPLSLVSPRLVNSAGTVVFDGSQVFLDTGRIRRLKPAPQDDGSEVVSARVLDGDQPARAWLPGTCLAVSAELLDRAGGFDELYFLYWEDVDLSVRCVDAGGELVIRHDLSVVHDEGGTQDRRGRALSSRYYFWNCRNRLLFAARHLPPGQIMRWIMHTPNESWQILLRGGRRQLIRSPAPFVATVRGSLAGIALALSAVLRPRATRIWPPLS